MNTPKNMLLALTLLVLLYCCGNDNKDIKRNALSKNNIEKVDSIIQSTSTFNEKMSIISIIMDTLDISGPNGVLTNYNLRGKKSERPAYFSYYKDSKLLFEKHVNVRLQGGLRSSESLQINRGLKVSFSTKPKKKKFNFKLTNKIDKDYYLKRLSIRKSHFLIEELAYSFYKKINVRTNFLEPVILFVNGENFGVYSIYDTASDKNFKSYIGHDDFIYFKHKSEQSSFCSKVSHKRLDKLIYNANEDDSFLKKFYKSLPIPYFRTIQKMTISEINPIIDVAKLSRQYIAVMFLGTTDWNQGVLVKETDNNNNKYFWIAMDLDHSFKDVREIAPKDSMWKQKVFYPVDTYSAGIRSKLFNRLVKEDNEYGEYFINLMFNVLNHELDSAFMFHEVEKYNNLWGKMSKNKNEYHTKLLNFVKHRPDFVREKFIRYFKKDSIYNCSIFADDTISYQIDGYIKKGNYSGKYYSNQIIDVEAPPNYYLEFGDSILFFSKDNPIHNFEMTKNLNLKIERFK